jgi:predicted FMN-binding regulatory protein PaiB
MAGEFSSHPSRFLSRGLTHGGRAKRYGPRMIYYDYYADVPEGAVADFVRSARLARLVTVGDGAMPHIGLYPFYPVEGGFELHLHKDDEQIADLRARPACLIELDEVLSTIPSYFVHPENAVFATAYHRTVAFECASTLVEGSDEMAAQQARIISRYQPEGRYRAVRAGEPMYGGVLGVLVGLKLVIQKTKVKFKLGQNRDLATRARIVEQLRARNAVDDARTADALQWTIDLGWTTEGLRPV